MKITHWIGIAVLVTALLWAANKNTLGYGTLVGQ